VAVAEVLAGERRWAVVQGDVLGRAPGLPSLDVLPDRSVHLCVTSVPYWALRSYLADDHALKPYEIGLERTPEEYLEKIVACFRAVRRVLRDDGTLWVNVGDTYYSTPSWGRNDGTSSLQGRKQSDVPQARREQLGRRRRGASPGLKPKDLVGVPWMVAFALRADGWYLRRDHVWHKPNAMPESVYDRCAGDHEYVFQFSKRPRYFFDAEANKVPVSGNAHARGRGLNPKAASIEPGDHRNRPKQNSSFAVAVGGLVDSRNRRSVWSILTQPYPGAHYATFPTELASIPIRAGTPERGCCRACGAPWSRRWERTGHVNGRQASHSPIARKATQSDSSGWAPTRWASADWRPSCACDAGEPVPAIVLDVFNGSGRSGVAALRLGRRYIGFDLDPDSIEQSRAQIEGDAPMFNREPEAGG
jgi:DNA modification methylase